MNSYLVQYATEWGLVIPTSQPRVIRAHDVEGAATRFLRDDGVPGTPSHLPEVGVWQARKPDQGRVFVRVVRTREIGGSPWSS